MRIQYITSALIICSAMVFTSCEQKSKGEETSTEENKADSLTTTDSSSDLISMKKKQEINANLKSYSIKQSLRWEKQKENAAPDGGQGSEFLKVEAYLNDDESPVKIVEHFSMGNFKPQGERTYYLEDDKLIAYTVSKTSWIDSNRNELIELQSFYKDGEPFLTRKRSTGPEVTSKIEDQEWEEMEAKHHSLDQVTDILEGKNEFHTHFISVISANNQLFLLLGEDKPKDKERYTTAVLVPKKIPIIEDLLEHLEEYKFRPLDIKVKVVGGKNKPIFRVLTEMEWED